MRAHEHILVFYQKLPTYNPQMTEGHEPLHYAVNKSTTKLYGNYNGVESRTGSTNRYPRSVLEFDVVNQTQRYHPTQKPIELIKYLIETYSNKNDLVLDNTAGSCVLAFACSQVDRNFICIEKNKEYIEEAYKRYSENIFFQ